MSHNHVDGCLPIIILPFYSSSNHILFKNWGNNDIKIYHIHTHEQLFMSNIYCILVVKFGNLFMYDDSAVFPALQTYS